VTWTTAAPTTTQVTFGTTSQLGQTSPLNASMTTAHSVSLSGLTPSTTYFFQTLSQNAAGTVEASHVFTVRTNAFGLNPAPLASGWTLLSGTLQEVCPPNTAAYAFADNCRNVVAAWSGGIADIARNRLIVWGGGHTDYFGNEVYALGLSDEIMDRLNNPSPIADPNARQTVLADGTPNSRHTYGALAYIAHADRMFVFGGAPAASVGFGSNDTWTLDLASLTWQQMKADSTTQNRVDVWCHGRLRSGHPDGLPP
jgi:hypothetical protein